MLQGATSVSRSSDGSIASIPHNPSSGLHIVRRELRRTILDKTTGQEQDNDKGLSMHICMLRNKGGASTSGH